MRLIINLILLAIVAALVYVLIDSIREPINFKNERDKREAAVVDKLIQLRRGQELYRTIEGGKFASNWNDFKDVLSNGQIPFVKVIGDPDDPNFTGEVTYDTTYFSSADSITSLGWDLDDMVIVPFSDGKTFDVQADTISYQKTIVNVVEVGTKRSTFMGKYADESYKRYDARYEPNSVIKFGDMNKPNTSGNWER
ncbi:MAG: hypothetical protein AAF960_25940 [Bacteroidota bacterium]